MFTKYNSNNDSYFKLIQIRILQSKLNQNSASVVAHQLVYPQSALAVLNRHAVLFQHIPNCDF